MTPNRSLRRSLANFWLALFFWLARHAPWFPRLLKSPLLRGVWACSPAIRRNTTANAARLLAPASTPQDCRDLGRAVLANFYDSILEFAANRALDSAQLLTRLDSVTGESEYLEARRHKRGAILITAHLGSFETAMAMLRSREPRAHVVFRRDPFPLFERLRAEQHARLGVLDAAVDDGLPMWARLRDALAADEVVLMQADRVMPGQPGLRVPFLGGHTLLPTGPVKLARLTGAPIIPVFAVNTESREGEPRRVRIELHPPIWADQLPLPAPPGPPDTIDPALLRIALVIESVVRRHPEQWLCLHPVLIEDQPNPAAPPKPPA